MKLQTVLARIPSYPEADPHFACQRPETRARVTLVLGLMRESAQTSQNVGAAIEAFAARMALPVKTARKRWDNVLKRGWIGAADLRKEKKRSRELATRLEFIAFWQELCEKHNRSCRSAWQDLLLMWKGGVQIPGYADCNGLPPADPRTGLPKSWTYETLMKFAPESQELVLARIGRKAFSAKTTGLWTTRVGLHCGQVYQFDDVWHDHDIFIGKLLTRALELGCIDLFSTRRVLFGLAPRVKSQDAAQNLKERHMLWLTLALLMDTGYWAEGCTLIVEHRTAALPEWFEQQLFDKSGKIIRVDRSGIQDKPALLGWWSGEGGGNPRMKACLESLHGYFHNRLGLLPAQVGSNSRVDKPENLAAIEKYSEQLANQLAHFNPQDVDRMLGLLKLPALTFHQFHRMLHDYYTVIDSRNVHALEGWDRAGLVRSQWRLKDDSQDWNDAEELARLPAEQYQAIRAWLEGNRNLTRINRMSPLEVWTRQSKGLKRFQNHMLPLILGDRPELAREVTVRTHYIEFQDQEIDPDSIKFEGAVQDITGHKVLLREGEKYAAYINPLASGMLHVCDAAGRYLGAALRVWRTSRVNREDVYRAIGQEAGRQTERMLGVRARHEGDVTEHREMLAHNAAVLAGAPVTADEKAAAKSQADRIRAEKGGLDDMIPAAVVADSGAGDDQVAAADMMSDLF